MHELSVCQALLDQVFALAREQRAEAVERVTIECGPLSGVDPRQLADAFSVMRSNSIAAAAKLVIEPIGVSVLCLVCDARSIARPNRLLCGACGGYLTRVVSGDELRLRRVEMRVRDAGPGVLA